MFCSKMPMLHHGVGALVVVLVLSLSSRSCSSWLKSRQLNLVLLLLVLEDVVV